MPERESFTSPDSGHEYSFVHLPATRPSHPTLLFLHGFPSQLHDWAFQIAYFSSHGYGVVAPDLLGYGQSSKPDDAAQYRLKLISDDICRLLDHLDLPSVVGVGHDFGATLLSRMVAYEPTRWSALVFLAVGPPQMGTPFDLDMINSMTKGFLGYEFLGYITWLGGDEAEEAQAALESHPEAAMSLVFPADQSVWEEWYRPLGKMKQFVTEDRRVAVGSWYTPKLQQHHLDSFARKDGYKGAVRWYKMWKQNLFLPDEAGHENFKTNLPVLFIGDSNSAQQQDMLNAWAPRMKSRALGTSGMF
ncbi:unnamed protein product [Clonostachys solani]|uniref:AB hydrolase-1 domain-containing protein n=1 Tax=Clonostachys solani TaxID=160281 RepID=A0A9N9Z844_9HYPO|nr:unnamed protein product [Clonostachys solani]